jgi:uncharacterized membrane protein YfcA
MNASLFFEEYSLLTLCLVAIAGFIAGFIDSIVGGGGLIQTPFFLITFPDIALPKVLGTNKISALMGTSVAAVKYSKKVTFDFRLLLVIAASCFVASFLGAKLVHYLDAKTLKTLVLVILIVIAIYTFLKKDLGTHPTKELSVTKQKVYGALIGLVVGFYDGFFGPGTGSFFVLGFVVILGFEFVKASAYAKVVNCITNISALFVFVSHGNFILPIALLMGGFNMIGSYIGSSLALKNGNGFVRIIFLIIVSLMILKYGYEVFHT